MLCDFGYSQVLQKEIPSSHSLAGKALLGFVIDLKILTSLILMTVYLLVSRIFFVESATNTIIIIFWLSQVIAMYPLSVGLYFRARNRAEIESGIKILGGLFTFGFGIWFVLLLHKGLTGFVMANALASAIQLVATWMLCNRFGIHLGLVHQGGMLVRSFERTRALWRLAIPFGLLGFIGTISFRANTVIISLIMSTRETGLLNAATKILDVCLIIPGAVSSVTLSPLAVLMRKGDSGEAKELTEVLLKYAFCVSAILAMIVFFNSSDIVDFLYRKSTFQDSIPILRLAIWTVIPVFLSSLTSTVISAGPKPSINTMIAFCMMLFSVGANFVLIHFLGGSGAAIATVVTESLGLLMGFVYVREHILSISLQDIAGGLGLSIVASLAVYYFVDERFMGLPVVTTFVALLFLTGVLQTKSLSGAVKAIVGQQVGA
jgi:O-antigen/teichoic acid export membrane protein